MRRLGVDEPPRQAGSLMGELEAPQIGLALDPRPAASEAPQIGLVELELAAPQLELTDDLGPAALAVRQQELTVSPKPVALAASMGATDCGAEGDHW